MVALADGLALREATITDNFLLVHKFATRLPGGPVARAGGYDAVVCILTPNYINAVDAWLDRGQARGYALSTYVWKNLGHAWPRLLADEANIIHIPASQLGKVTRKVSQLDSDMPDSAAQDDLSEEEDFGQLHA